MNLAILLRTHKSTQKNINMLPYSEEIEVLMLVVVA